MTSIRDRIRKLLRLATDEAAAPGEADNAMRAAQRLMAEHHISESDVHATAEDMGAVEVLCSGLKRMQWEQLLASFVAKFAGCGACTCPPRGGHARFTFYGKHDAIRLASDLFKDLHRTAAATAFKRFKSVARGAGRSYCEGFAVGLLSQLKRAAATADAETQAIVVQSKALVAARQTEARAWFEKEHGEISGKARTAYLREGDPEAYRDGVRDGKSAQLGRRKAELQEAPQ